MVEFDDYLRTKRMRMHKMNKTLEKVHLKSAEQILNENSISIEPPIDLDELMKRLGISVREHDFTSVEEKTGLEKDSILGATLLVNDEVMILHKKYDVKRNNHGSRFTIAHELGHCALHAEDLVQDHLELRSDFYNKENSREKEACRFAGKLLIPDESLKDICKRLVIPSLSILAEIFDVSTSVMQERLDEAKIKYLNDISA